MNQKFLLTLTLVALLAVQATAYLRLPNQRVDGGTRISRHRNQATPEDCAALCEAEPTCTHAGTNRRRTDTLWNCVLYSAISGMRSAPRSAIFVMDDSQSLTYVKFPSGEIEIAAPFHQVKIRRLDMCQNACDVDPRCSAVSQKGKWCRFHDADATPKTVKSYPVWALVVAGCMDPAANNFNSEAVHDDGSCTFPAGMGCGNSNAINYDAAVLTHNEAMCEFPESGCMDPLASNYNEMVTSDDGSCVFPAGTGCGNMDALNYNSEVVTHNEAMCEFPPEFVLTPYPGKKYSGGIYVRRVNGANRNKCQQICIDMGDECHGINSISSKCYVYATNHHEQGSVAANSRTNYYAKERVGCTNSTALNFNTAAQAEWDPSTCRFGEGGTVSGGSSSSSSGGTSSPCTPSGPCDLTCRTSSSDSCGFFASESECNSHYSNMGGMDEVCFWDAGICSPDPACMPSGGGSSSTSSPPAGSGSSTSPSCTPSDECDVSCRSSSASCASSNTEPTCTSFYQEVNGENLPCFWDSGAGTCQPQESCATAPPPSPPSGDPCLTAFYSFAPGCVHLTDQATCDASRQISGSLLCGWNGSSCQYTLNVCSFSEQPCSSYNHVSACTDHYGDREACVGAYEGANAKCVYSAVNGLCTDGTTCSL